MEKDLPINVKGYKVDLGLLLTLLLSFLYTLVFFYICVFRYNTFQYHDWDFSLYINTMWNVIHGSPYVSIIERHFLRNHFTLIALVIAPIYFVFRHPLTLIFLQTLLLSLTSIPIYLLAKRKFNWRIGVGFVIIYLLYPSLLYVTMYEFHFESFAPFFLALAFYFLISNRKIWLFVSAFLAMLCKENIAPVVAAMGIYAFLFRPHRRKLGLVVFFFGLLYFLLVTLYLQPHFAPVRGYTGYAADYSRYGKGFANVYVFMLSHPLAIFKDLLLPALNRQYLKDMFSPLLFLPLLRPDILLVALPTILKNLLSRAYTTHTIYWHYTATIIPFLIISLIFGFKKLTRFNLIKKKNLIYILFLLAFLEIGMSFKYYQKCPIFARFRHFKTAVDISKRDAVKLIPENAAVIATFDFLPHLSSIIYLRNTFIFPSLTP